MTTGQFSFAGISAYSIGALETAAAGGRLKLYAGPEIHSTDISPVTNPLLATGVLEAVAFIGHVAQFASVTVSGSGIPTTALLTQSDGSILARFSVAGRAGFGDILIDDGTPGGATLEYAILTAGQALAINFQLTGQGGGSGTFDASIRGDGVITPRGLDVDYVGGYMVPVEAYAPGDFVWGRRVASPGLDPLTGDPLYPVYLVDPLTVPSAGGWDVKVKTGAYTMTEDDAAIVATGSGGWTLGLPTATGASKFLLVKNATTGVITLDANAAETVEGAASIDVAAGNAVMLLSDQTEWKVC